MIAVDGVTKRYGALVAVDDLSFRVGRGEVVGFLGPNGAGKTTTMRMLAGTLQPDAGEVRLDGRPIGEHLTGAKSRLGYMPEANALYTEMLVSEYLDFTAQLRGLSGAARKSGLADAIEQTGTAEVYYRPISQLSKGYRQRVGLAAAILHRPEVLILDEPTEGLDPNQRVEIRRLVKELGRERTVILSTHVLGEVEATCSRLLIISRGRLAADGGVAELLDARGVGARYVVEAEGDGVAEALSKLAGVARHRAERVDGRARVELTVRGAEELRPVIFRLAADRGWTLWELHRERASLEQLFRELTDTPAGPGAGEPDAGVPETKGRRGKGREREAAKPVAAGGVPGEEVSP
jgi:ABC-2 type transport system ATP-binding protein